MDGHPIPYRPPSPDSAKCGWSVATGQFRVGTSEWSIRQVRLNDCDSVPEHARATTYRVSGRLEHHGDTLQMFVADTSAVLERPAGLAVVRGDTLFLGAQQYGDARSVYVREPGGTQ